MDCRSLGQFPALRSLNLWGAIAHPEAPAALPLRALELPFVPDLDGLPGLAAWPARTAKAATKAFKTAAAAVTGARDVSAVF